MVDPAQVTRAMLDADAATQHLGIQVESCALGSATASVRVSAVMLNAHHLCHGGYIFLLADTAFAYACNNANLSSVAAGCSIEFLAPAHLNDRLIARARERTQRGRYGVYDVDVFNQNNELIAVFRGKSARISGQIVKEEPHAGEVATTPRAGTN
jgi:acyl-CoA thioesterase